jgi:alkylation response protein AidB-like acyl-CoA dehydrogenase
MDFQLTAEQLEIQQRTRAFAHDVLKPDAAKWDEEERYPEPMVRRAAELGFLGLTIPKEYGGSGTAGPIESILVIEEMARGCANTAEIIFESGDG